MNSVWFVESNPKDAPTIAPERISGPMDQFEAERLAALLNGPIDLIEYRAVEYIRKEEGR